MVLINVTWRAFTVVFGLNVVSFVSKISPAKPETVPMTIAQPSPKQLMCRRMRYVLSSLLALGLLMGAPKTLLANYQLGAGDVVRVSVYGQDDLTVEARISHSQTIPFPLIGSVAIGGMSTTAAQARIEERLRSGGFLKTPQVNVMVTEFNSQQVSILGHVKAPGKYAIRSSERIVDMIAAAGGVDSEGDTRVIVVRGDKSRQTIDLPKLFENGAASQNFTMKGGDMIYVPRAPVFYVYGEVRKPGSYRLERDMTVIQAISVGGGLTARGTDRDLKIKRRGSDGKVITLPAKLVDRLQADDVVLVDESIF